MIGWNKSYNWTYEQFKKVMDDCFIKEKRNSITLDTEHSDYENEQQIVKWSHDLGYGAVVIDGGDRIIISKAKKSKKDH